MVNQQLLDYIKQQLQQGVPQEVISNNLISQGWQQQDANEAFSRVNGQIPRNDFSIIESFKFGLSSTIKNIGVLLRIFWSAILIILVYVFLVSILKIPNNSLLENIIDFPVQILSTIFISTLLLVSFAIVDGHTEDLRKMNVWSGFL